MANPVYEQAATQVATLIEANISLTGIATDTVEVRELNWEDLDTVGGITVRWDPTLVVEGGGSEQRDDWGYPCYVMAIRHGRHQFSTDEVRAFYRFRQDCKRYFHNQRRMTGVSDTGTNNHPCKFDPKGPRVPRNLVVDKAILAFTILCWFRESRTN